MIERLQCIRPRLQELARRDERCQLFGASAHRYHLAPPLQEDEVRTFELIHGVRLPEEYREFLLNVGSGGAGPYYGLKPLGNFEHAAGHCADAEEEPLDWQYGVGLDPEFLATPFPAGRGWLEQPDIAALDDDEANELLEQWEETAWNDKWVAGTICLAEHGCNIRELLVVSGDERGHIWTDARCDGINLYPIKRNVFHSASSASSTYVPMFLKADAGVTTFLDWYEWWLDWAINETSE